ncbi:kinase-like domain-containing protein [Trichoderma camerunense]
MGDKLTSAILSEGFMGLKLFGTGTHGQIYGAYDKKLDNMVAIKKLDISTPAHGERLKQDITAIKKARHRNIVPILYALVRPRMALLVIPPKPSNLHALIPLQYDLNLKTSAFYCLTIQMLSALTYLQEEGLSHRNIKPTNILVEASGPGFHFQLTDFALAQPLAITDINKTYYKAPETYVDTYPLTTKQDVWSLFVTLAISCGYLSETELSNRPPSAAAWAVVEAGVQMGELEAMAQQNPTLRASASVMFHQLRPKERVNSRGEVEYPEVSPDYVGLYGSGRLEKDAVIPLGPRADVRTLTGPLGLGSGASVSPLPPATPEPYQYLPSGLGLFDESTAMAIEAPNERMPSPSSHSGSFQKQPDYEHLKFHHYDSVNQRCLASCCNNTNTNTNNSNTPRSLSWTSSSQPLSPYAPSFVPVSPPLAPTTPLPLRSITPTETWDIWGVYKVANTINFSSKDYVRPYPMACDSQEDQVMEDVPLEDYKWTEDDDGPVAINPWQSPLLSFVS